jgi:hypothetical protein
VHTIVDFISSTGTLNSPYISDTEWALCIWGSVIGSKFLSACLVDDLLEMTSDEDDE